MGWLWGGDTLVGGAGNDAYMLHSLLDRVVELSGGGHDTIVHRDPAMWAAWYHLPAEVEDFRVDNAQVQWLRVLGNALDNHLMTTGSDDSLFGGAGTDTLVGLGGNDIYQVDRADDIVIEASGGGDLDEVLSSAASYVLPAHVEVLRMSGPAVEGTGNDLANLIEGNEAASRLTGMGGNDTLRGYAGDDTFIGGAGDDMIQADRGYDTVIFSGKMADYLVTQLLYRVTVEGADGRDVLEQADRLVFDDGEMLLNHRATGQAAIVGTLQSGATLTGSLGGLIEPDGVQSIMFAWELDGNWSFGESLQIGELSPGYHDVKLTVSVWDKLGFHEQFADRIEIGTPPVEPPTPAEVPAQLLEIETMDDGLTVLLHFDKAPRRYITAEPASIALWKSSEDMVELAAPGSAVSLEGATIRVHLPRPFEPGEQVLVRLSGHFEVTGWPLFGALAWFKAPAAGDFDSPGPTPLGLLGEQTGTGEAFNVMFRERVMPASGQALLKDGAGNVIERFDVQDADVVEFIGTRVRLASVQFLEAGRDYTLEFPAGVLLDSEGVPGQTLQFALDTGMRWVYGTGDGPGRLFVGDERHEHLYGSGGDTLVGAGGNDWLNGGWQDATIALYQGKRSDYRIEKMDPAVQPPEPFSEWWVADQIAGRDGTDAVGRVAWLQFEDYRVDLRIGELAAALPSTELRLLQELYVAFFGRIPEAGGLSFWLGEMKAGASLSAVAERFHDAGVQFGVFAAGQTNEAFIKQLYANVLGRDEASGIAPTADEIAYWRAPLESGALTRGTLVLQMLQDVHTGFDGHAELGWVERLLDHKGALAHWYAVEQALGLHTAQDDIAFGKALAALVTPDGFEAALELVGVGGVAEVGFA